MTPTILEKKKAVIRDWFKLVFWYIRLRKAAKSSTISDTDLFYFKFNPEDG